MPFKPLYTKFPDIDAARLDIQTNATSLESITTWIKANGWFFVAVQLRMHQNVWSEKRQRNYHKAHKDFQIDYFTLAKERNGFHDLSGYIDTGLSYEHVKQNVTDEVDFGDGLSVLGLAGSGGGSSRGDTIRATRCARVRAQHWQFVAVPTILATIGTSVWSDVGSGAKRWFPHADLEKLKLLHQTVGFDEQGLRALLNAGVHPTVPETVLLNALHDLAA